jgi:hypothetical protein
MIVVVFDVVVGFLFFCLRHSTSFGAIIFHSTHSPARFLPLKTAWLKNGREARHNLKNNLSFSFCGARCGDNVVTEKASKGIIRISPYTSILQSIIMSRHIDNRASSSSSSSAYNWMEDETPRETANASEMAWVEQQQRLMAAASLHPNHRHEEESSSSSFQETARPSDMVWVEQNMMAATAPRQESAAAALNAGDDCQDDDDDDRTWTGSFFVATLEGVKSQKEPEKQKSSHSSQIGTVNNDDQAQSSGTTEKTQSATNVEEIIQWNDSFELPARRCVKSIEQRRRTPGPSERAYLARYSVFVSKKMNAFRQQNPNIASHQLRDYRAMNPSQQQHEQQRVLNLLNRLGITNHHHSDHEEEAEAMQEDEEDGENDDPPNDIDVVEEMMRDHDLTVDDEDDDNTKKGGVVVKESDKNSNESNAHGVEEDSQLTVDEASMLLLTPKRTSVSMVLLTPRQPHQVGPSSSGKRSRDISREPKLPTDEAAAADNNDENAEIMSSPDFPQPEYPSDSSTQSIERARSCRFHSPSDDKDDEDAAAQRHKKRLATSSGKGGADASRSRARVHFDRDNDDEPMSSEKILEESMRRLSVAPIKVFTASQSPILPLTDGSQCRDDDDDDKSSSSSDSSSDSDHFAQKDISFGHADDDDDNVDNTGHYRETSSQSKSSYRDSIDESARCDSSRKPFSNIPPNQGSTIRLGATLKRGATFHLQPLPVERHRQRAPPTQHFSDPLEDYHGREHKILYRIYKWIRGQEKVSTRGCTAAVVLSMTDEQIVDVTLKVLLKDTSMVQLAPCESSQSQADASGGGGNSNQGQTLIVTRTREELEYWSRAIREGSGLSTVNHSTLPVKERKSISTAKRCCRFGVVLTTFDALKSPDVTVSLDENGFVRFSNVGVEDGGWFSTRDCSQVAASQAAQPWSQATINTNKQLSVLHLVQWKRVIFVDEVGRKTYLAKPETARFVAVRALAAASRLVFFPKGQDDDEEESGIKALIHSDKKALKTLAAALRLEGESLETCKLREKIVDFTDATTIPSNTTTTRGRSKGGARDRA